jgi:DNA-binding response OmpR family regulator
MSQDKKTVLIVEDEENIREIYKIAFLKDEFEVLQAVNGAEGLTILESEHQNIDVILLDIVMPVMDGFETLKKIKEDSRFADIPAVMCTNLDNEGDKKQALEMGVALYFVKSQHTPLELVGDINALISKK